MTSFVEKAVFEFAPIDTAQCVIRCMVHSGRQWSNVVPKQKLNKQTNKQIKQTNNTVSMSSSMVVWLVRSHVVSKIAPILPLKTFECVYGEFAPILYATFEHRGIHT